MIVYTVNRKKCIILLTIFGIVMFLWMRSKLNTPDEESVLHMLDAPTSPTDRDKPRLSVLGRRLFLHEPVGDVAEGEYVIYVHKLGPRIENRFFGNHAKNEAVGPLRQCR